MTVPQASPNDAVAAVILAAGKSTRMRSKVPKTLHRVCGKPILHHVLDAARGAGIGRCVVVVGHEAQVVIDALQGTGDAVSFVHQAEQKGTGHAVQMAAGALSDHTGPVLVLAGDTPLLTAETVAALCAAHTGGATVLTAILDDAGSYGRIVRDADGAVIGIVEARDATPEQAAIREINAGMYLFDGPALFTALAALRPDNAQGELYLTDVIGLLRRDGLPVRAVIAPDAAVTLGVNTRIELADCETRLRRRILDALMLSGVTVIDPATTYVDADVAVGQDTVLHPGTVLTAGTVIGDDCVIGPYTVIEDSVVDAGSRVGPFARIRPRSVIGRGGKIGNFVELKNAQLGHNVSAGHLTYLGDATIGANTNIGAGTITCNWDGFQKHRTEIGAGAFIGSNATLVAPVTVEDGAATAAGSVINRRVPTGDLALGRARQENKEGWWATRRARKERDA
jgi:bifunctional UDP-N-acetylglucosamine pyrophosphorylase/glucosamine-1-phosphate N-acetyltransferase